MSYSYGTGKYHDELLSNLAAGIGDADYGPPIARVYGRAKVTPRITYMASGSGARDVWAPGTILKDGDLGRADIGSPNSYSAPVVMELCQEGANVVGVFMDKEQSSPETQVTETTSATSYTVSHAADYNRDLGVKDSNGRGLTQVNSAPWVGTYYCPTPGTYQFAAGQGTVQVKYGYVQWSVTQALQAIRRLSGATVVNGGHWSFANAGATGSPTWVPNDQCSIQPFPFQVIRGSGLTGYICGGTSSVLLGTTPVNESGALYTNTNVSSAWSALNGTNAEGMGFTGTAHLRFERLALTEDMHIPAIAFLVDGIGGRNCSPVTALRDLLVNVLGLPSAGVITSVGADGQAASSFTRYCANMPQFVINRAIDSREDAFRLLADILDATNSELFYSQGYIKVVPLADTAFGTFTPAGLAGDINLMDEGTADLLTINITDEKDVYSAFAVNFPDIVKNGEQGQAMGFDDAYANLHGGRRLAPAVDNSWISTSAHAHLIAQLMVRRSTRIRRRFSFTVIAKKWACLEAGDVVSVSDAIRLNNQLCRISLVEEQDDGSFAIEAWEWAQGNCHPVIVTPQVHEGVRPLLNVQPATDAAFQASLVAGCSKDAGTTAVAAQGTATAAQSTANTASQTATQAQQAAADAAAAASQAQGTASTAAAGLALRALTNLSNADPGSVTPSLFSAGLCFNLLPNGDFSAWDDANKCPAGWGRDNSQITVFDTGPYLNADWSLLGNTDRYNTQWLNTPFISSGVPVGGADPYVLWRSPLIPVQAGRRYCVSVYSAAHRCTVLVYAVFLDANGNATGWSDIAPSNCRNASETGGGQGLDGYKRIFSIGTAPAGSVKCFLRFIKGDTNAGETSSYMFLCRAQFEELPANASTPGNWTPPAANIVTALNLKADAALIDKLNVTGLLTVNAANVTGTLNASQISAVSVSCGMGRYTVGKQITRAVLSSITSPIAVGTSQRGTGRWVAMDPTGTYILTSCISAGYANLFTAFNAQTVINPTTGWGQNYGECIWRPDVGQFAVCSGSGHIGLISTGGTYSEKSTYNSLAMAVSPYNGAVVAGAGQVGDYRYWTAGSSGTMGTGSLPVAAWWQSVQALYTGDTFKGWLFVGQDGINAAVAVYLGAVGGTAYNLSPNLPNNVGGVVTGARTSTANYSCSGIACGCVDGTMFIITQNKVWTANVGAQPFNSPWTDRGAPLYQNGSALGVVPSRIKCTAGTAVMLPSPTNDNAYFTLDGVNWTQVNITGGCPGGVRAIGVTGKQTGTTAQYYVLRGAGEDATCPIAVVASGIANETLD